MNFLSHYYFVQHSKDPYLVLGMVLPDMVKNHRKNWNLHPYKYAQQLAGPGVMASVYKGWELHLETDRLFHSSSFFREHSSLLRKEIAAFITRLPFRPFFLAHVAIELLLDSLLIVQQKVDTDRFYLQLARCDPGEIIRFLEINKVAEAASFATWFSRFRENAYLYSYSDAGSLSYALDRIGQRVWQIPFGEEERDRLAVLLQAYRSRIEKEYLPIFEQISYYLRPLL